MMQLNFTRDQKINLSIGIVGSILLICGNLLTRDFDTAKKLCYLLGSVVLLIMSVREKSVFFTALQVIVLTATALVFLSISPILKAGVPIGLSLLSAIYFGSRGEMKDSLTWWSMVSIVLLALGYAVANPIIRLVGGISMAIYSFLAFRRGVVVGLLFGVLNIFFVLTALWDIYHFLNL